MDFKGLSNAVINTPSLLPSMGITRRKMVLAQSSTNGPRLLSHPKTSTHSPLLKKSHTAAHTPKQGAFRMGVLSLPLIRAARSRTSPGRVSERQPLSLLGLDRICSRRSQRALGTAMRLCASLFRRRRGPAGLRCSVCNLVMLLFFHSVRSTF